MSQQINLFNPVFLKQKKYFSAATMAQALALILVGSVLVGIFARYQLTSLTQQAASTSQQLARTRDDAAKINVQFGPNDNARLLAAKIQKEESDLRSLKYVFDAIEKSNFGNAGGYANYFRAFSRQIIDGLWITGFTVIGTGSELSLQGRALRPELVPTYIGHLKREPMMQGKSFAKLDMQLPMADPIAKVGAPASASAPASKGMPAFIEFNLQSTDTGPKTGQAGAAK